MVDCRRMDIDSWARNVDVSQLCRLCAVQDEHIIPIFEGHGLDLEFEIKLQKYLSLKVSRNDILPLNLCLKCTNTLLSWHDLVIGCEEAEKRLLALLCEQGNTLGSDVDVIPFDDNTKDSIKIENDTADVHLVSQPNNSSTYFGTTSSLNATSQGQQSSLPDSGGTVVLSPNTAIIKDFRSVQHRVPLVINRTSPTSRSKKARSVTSKNKRPVTIQPYTGLLPSSQSSSTPVGDSSQLKIQEVKNIINIQSSPQTITGENTTSRSPTPSSDKKPFVDITLSGKKFKAIVKPFLISRPENTDVARPQPVTVDRPHPVTVDRPQPVTVDRPQPVTVDKPQLVTIDAPQRQDNTNIITLLIPGLIPPNSTPLLSTDSSTNTPVITLPVILPEPSTSSANQVPNIPEDAFLLDFDPAPEIKIEESSNLDLFKVDTDSRGPSPCYLDSLTGNNPEPNVQEVETYNGPATQSTTAIKVEQTETDEKASEEEETLCIIAHEDHRYSKSAKVLVKSASKPQSKDAASARKSLLKALKRRSKQRGCFLCGKVIHHRALLASHERSHFKTLDCLSYNCSLCSESFKTFEEMVSHRKKHKNPKRDVEKMRLSKPNESVCASSSYNGISETVEGAMPSEGSKAKHKSTKRNPDEIRLHIKCVICGICFKSKNDLNEHKLCHTEEEKNNAYVCPTCKKGFSNNGALKSHLKIHTEGPGEQCQHCGKVFKLKSTLNQHVRRMHDVPNPWPRYECEYCPRKFDSRAKLSCHSNCHTGDRPYRCNKCDKGFHSSSNLRQHLACHEDARPSMCHVCGKTFKWQKNLKQHALTHKANKEDPVQCDLCGKKLNGISSLKTHKYRFHRDAFFLENPNVERLPCHLCSRVFSSNVNLDLHMNRFHADGKLRFACDVCGKRFTTKVGRNDHLRLHTGERPYACDHCDKTFTSASNLCAHKDAHSERRPHQCPYCEKQFKRKAHLDCHVRSHTGEKPYVCDVCNRGFAQSNDMRKHRGIHFNERSFQCSFCENTFKKKKDLLRHLTKHCVSERQEDESDEIDYSAILQSDQDANVAYDAC